MPLEYDELKADLKEIKIRLDGHEQRHDSHDQWFSVHDKRFDGIDKKLSEHDKRFDGIDKKLSIHEQWLGRLDKKFDDLGLAFRELGIKFELLTGEVRAAFDYIVASNRRFEAMEYLHGKVENHEHRISAVEGIVRKQPL